MFRRLLPAALAVTALAALPAAADARVCNKTADAMIGAARGVSCDYAYTVARVFDAEYTGQRTFTLHVTYRGAQHRVRMTRSLHHRGGYTYWAFAGAERGRNTVGFVVARAS